MFQELKNMSQLVTESGGEASWLRCDDIWLYDYYGSAQLNTIEPVGARSFWKFLLSGKDVLLHVALSGQSSTELEQRLKKEPIISVDLYDWEPLQTVTIAKSLEYVQIEATFLESLNSMLECVADSEPMWISIKTETIGKRELEAISSLRTLDVLSIDVWGEPASNLKLSRYIGTLRQLSELHLAGFASVDFDEIDEILKVLPNLESISLWHHALSTLEVERLQARWPSKKIYLAKEDTEKLNLVH